MSEWNHRVVRRTVTEAGTSIDWLGIHECFYDEGREGWTENPVAVEGETLDDLRETLERMLRALDKPIIDGTDDPLRQRQAQVSNWDRWSRVPCPLCGADVGQKCVTATGKLAGQLHSGRWLALESHKQPDPPNTQAE